ncbi:uncharacterized protein LOC144553462 [Carex rostrata]
MAPDQPFPVLKYFSDFIVRFDRLLTCPACNRQLQEPMLLTCDHILCRMCIPTGKSVTCPKCNIISYFKDVTPSIFMEEMIKIFKEADKSLRDITRELVSGNVSSAAENSSTSMPDERKKLVLLGCARNPYETVSNCRFR